VAALHRGTRDRPRAGFLGATFDLGDAWAEIVTRGAEHPRLAGVRDRLLGVVRDQRARISALGPPFSLLHGDCKPTNVRVGEDGALLALLDWEFAWVGSPWSDLGQLARWADRYPEDFVPGLVDGYEPEDPGWRELGALLDLINLAQFLVGPERAAVHRDAAERVVRTLRAL
jgi:Ser/Thr protein kinase RdoA (MazF antagonist)